MKIFTLNPKVFVQAVESEYEIIEWTFEWNGILYTNVEFEKLCVNQYCNN